MLKWLHKKFKRQYKKINPIEKLRFERSHQDWQKDKCVNCKLLKMEPTNYLTPDNQMTFGNFIIRYEHKFLRKFILLNKFKSLITLKLYRVIMKYFENIFRFALDYLPY